MSHSFEIGGLKVISHVDKEKLNAFVAELPPDKKGDIKDVLLALHEAGLITIEEKIVH